MCRLSNVLYFYGISEAKPIFIHFSRNGGDVKKIAILILAKRITETPQT